MASLIDGKVRLQWSPVDHATEYKIQRKEAVPQNNDDREEITRVTDTFYVDLSVEPEHKYVYQVIAVNQFGESPPSPWVSIFVERVWLRIKDVPGFGFVDVVEGGDAGLESTMTFPNVEEILTCQSEGIKAVEHRPATDVTLSSGWQTFSVTLAYNLSTTTSVNYFAWTSSRQFSSLFDKEHVIEPGCGLFTISYTVDLSDVPPTSSIFTDYVSPLGGRFFGGYHFQTSRHIEIVEIAPPFGGSLTGQPIKVTVEYQGMTGDLAEFRLVGGTKQWLLGSSVTAVVGKGRFTIPIEYKYTCGLDRLSQTIYQLRLDFDFIDETEEFHTYSAFMAAMPGTVQLAPRYRSIWNRLSENSGTSVTLQAEDCEDPAGSLAVTYSTQIGTINKSGTFGTTVSTTTDQPVSLWLNSLAIDSLGYGSHPVTVSAQIGSYPPTSSTVNLNIIDLFWKIAPPNIAQGGSAYPIEVTGIGLPIDAIMTYHHDGFSEQLRWNGQSFTGLISYKGCGWFGFRRLSLNIDGYEMTALTAPDIFVGTSSVYSLSSSDNHIELNPELPVGVYLQESCGRPIQWTVIHASPWIQFERLTGSNEDPLKMKIDLAEAYAEYPSGKGYGRVVITSNPASDPFILYVNFDQ